MPTQVTDLKERVTARIEELAKATDLAKISKEMTQYMNTCAKFHHYSLFNIINILTYFPEASFVAGYHKWLQLHRYVRKGEHGIPIFAPIIKKMPDKHGDEKAQVVNFKVVYVFDVSQTDGEPLPEMPEWKSLERRVELQEKLTAYARSLGIIVVEQALEGETQGLSHGGLIEITPESGTKTLIHEIAHELLHKRECKLSMSRDEKEMEAESVAYTVATYFGMEDLSSPNYIALYGADAAMVMQHLERIRDTATAIINAVDPSTRGSEEN